MDRSLVTTAGIVCAIPAWLITRTVTSRAGRAYRQHVHQVRERAVYQVGLDRGSAMCIARRDCPDSPDVLLPFDPTLRGVASRLSSEVACQQALDRGLVDGWIRSQTLRLEFELHTMLAEYDHENEGRS